MYTSADLSLVEVQAVEAEALASRHWQVASWTAVAAAPLMSDSGFPAMTDSEDSEDS